MRLSTTQRQSIAKAAKSLEQYDDADVQSNVVDLVTDLKHFCDFWGIDFEGDVLRLAQDHHSLEASDAQF